VSVRLKAAALITAIGMLAGFGSAAAAQADPAEVGQAQQPAPCETDVPADRFGFVAADQLQVSTGTDDNNLTFRVALPDDRHPRSAFRSLWRHRSKAATTRCLRLLMRWPTAPGLL
jgi:hypothetical protein